MYTKLLEKVAFLMLLFPFILKINTLILKNFQIVENTRIYSYNNIKRRD